MNVVDSFKTSANRFPTQIAFEDQNRAITYRELDERTNRLANYLNSIGLNKGDKCGVLLFNSVRSVECLIGLAKAGVVTVPLNFRFSSPEIEYIAGNSEAKALITSSEFLTVVSESDLAFGNENILVAGLPPDQAEKGYRDYEAELARASASEPQVVISERDVYYIGYTSGTTSFPKGAVVTHGKFIDHALTSMFDYARITEDHRFLLIMPLCHSNSIWFSSFMFMAGGYAYIYPSTGFDPLEILRIIEAKQISMTSVVPTMLNFILNLSPEQQGRYSQDSLTDLLVASSPLTTTTKEGALEFFSHARLYEAYGSTETGLVTTLRPRYQWEKKRCIGRCGIFKEIKLLDDSGAEVPVGQPGELFARGRGVMLSEYYNNPQATAEAFRGEYVTVGDVAKMDEEGFYYLVDRKKDMIISGGENVSPAEVENCLHQHPAVLEAAVIGLPDAKWGEAVTAVVVLKQGMDAQEAEILQHCRERLAGFKSPKQVHFVGELAKTATQKISRRLVKQEIAGDVSLYDD